MIARPLHLRLLSENYLALKGSKLSPTRSTTGLLCGVFLFHIDVSTGQNSGPWDVPIRCSASRSLGHDRAVLVDELEVVTAKQMGYGGKLRSVAGGIVVELEEGDSQKLHVFGDAQNLCENVESENNLH